MSHFLLYHTLGCHLCDEAQAIIDPIATSLSVNYSLIDIADDDRLLEAYGWLIPVFKYSKDSQYLQWPFTDVEVLAYMQSHLT